MKEWYMTTPIPNQTSGYEDDAISQYAQSNFADVLETTFSDTVTMYNSDLSESKIVKCIVQDNMADTSLKSLQREILFPIGTSVAGNYIFFDGSYWLLIGRPGNNKSYEKITASLCTFKLRWQNKSGKIIERWVYSEDFTKYSSGVYGNSTIYVGDNQYGLTIPIDEETKILVRDMRFPIDFDDAKEPEIYMLTNRKVILNNYLGGNKGGTIILTLSYNAFNKEKDKLVTLSDGDKVWIADYKEPDINPTPPDEAPELSAKISGSSSLKVGFGKTYYVVFSDKDGNVIENIDFKWNVSSDFDVYETLTGENIKLRIDDESYVGKSFTLQVLVDNKVAGSFLIDVVSIF